MDPGIPVLKRSGLALAVSLAVTLGGMERALAQFDYRPPGSGFQVAFPAPPRIAQEMLSTRFGNTRSVMARLERDGGKFYAQYFDYPAPAANEGAQKLLDGLRFGRTAKGTVRREQRFELDGHPAQRETVDLNFPARPVIVALDVLRGLRLYSIFCIVDRGQEDAPEVRAFIDSFVLLPL